MDVKRGHKQTKSGVIPEDWKVATVGDEFSIQLGKMLKLGEKCRGEEAFLG